LPFLLPDDACMSPLDVFVNEMASFHVQGPKPRSDLPLQKDELCDSQISFLSSDKR
jgi:hypothetical protein